jgi:hypothetical protein
MSINLSKLIDHDPYEYLDTEIGRLAIFDLSVSGADALRRDTKGIADGEAFARILSRFTCFPAESLRNGRFKPSEPCLTDQQIAALSRKTLESVTDILRPILLSLEQSSNERHVDDRLSAFMKCMRHQWEQSDRSLIEAMVRTHGRFNQFDALNERINQLFIPPPAPMEAPTMLLDNPIPEIRSVLKELNEIVKSSSEQSYKEARFAKFLATASLVVALISLISAPLSRITCSFLRDSSLIPWSRHLSSLIEVTCGYKARQGASYQSPSKFFRVDRS